MRFPRGTLPLLCGAALVIRVGFVLAQSASPFLDAPFVSGDALFYLNIARNIADGHGMAADHGPTAFVGPVYPLFLAGLLKVGLDPVGIGLAQALLGSLTVALIALTAAQLAPAGAGERWRLLAAGAAAVYPHLVFWTGYVLTETLFVFLAVGSILALLVAARTGARSVAAVAGLCAATAALTRPPFLAIAAVLAAWWILREARSARSLLLPAAFVVGVAVPMSAWTLRNYVTFGAPVVTTTESGNVFYQGNSRTSNGGSRGYVDVGDWQPLDLPPGLSEVDKDAAYLRAALADVRDDPAGTLARWPAKAWNMWRPTYEGASLRNGALTIATYLPVLVLGLVGAWWLARRGLWSLGSVPALVLAVWVAVHLVVTGMIRFRLPAEAILLATLPAGADAAGRVWRRARER